MSQREGVLGVQAGGGLDQRFDALASCENVIQILDHLLLHFFYLTVHHLHLVIRTN